jgi:hypothetical protein
VAVEADFLVVVDHKECTSKKKKKRILGSKPSCSKAEPLGEGPVFAQIRV